MGIVHNFEKHKYILPVQGAGIVDTVTNFVTQNKDTLMDTAKAVSSVSMAINAAKRFNELRDLQKNKDKILPKVVNELKAVAQLDKKGDGFEKF